jgi:hypothetical protein
MYVQVFEPFKRGTAILKPAAQLAIFDAVLARISIKRARRNAEILSRFRML